MTGNGLMDSADALLAIQELMDGVEWTPNTLNEVAAIMVKAGYRIRDIDDVDIEMDDDTEQADPRETERY